MPFKIILKLPIVYSKAVFKTENRKYCHDNIFFSDSNKDPRTPKYRFMYASLNMCRVLEKYFKGGICVSHVMLWGLWTHW